MRIFFFSYLSSVVEGNASVQYCQGEIPLHSVVDDKKKKKNLGFVSGNCFEIVFCPPLHSVVEGNVPLHSVAKVKIPLYSTTEIS